ncbi:MAG: hypothetical protein JWN60_736 [Acidobacteria bacterium]|jgi:hypothetical protein|nr:hypothetical protein [Acidobacteriota bacterium]
MFILFILLRRSGKLPGRFYKFQFEIKKKARRNIAFVFYLITFESPPRIRASISESFDIELSPGVVIESAA